MKWRSICSVTSKSAITPSLSGRIAVIVPGRAAQHPLRLDADRVDLAVARVDRHHRGLGEHDAAPANVDERVCGAEVDRHVAAAESGQVAEDAHMQLRGEARPIVPDALECPASSGEPKQFRRQLEQQPDRQPDHIRDAPLDPRHQGRAERLDRVSAGAAAPLAELDIALLLGLARAA